MKKIILILLIMFSCILCANAETFKEEVSFVRCVDGDTALFSFNNENVKFRFLAIDTPETVHPTKEVEAFGKDASEYTCNKLTNAKFIVAEFEKSNQKDKYGRSLAWIWVDGSLLQKELVEAGYAEVAYIYGNYKYTESLCVVQQRAKEKQNGIWQDDRKEGYCASIDLNGKEDTIDKDYTLPSQEPDLTEENSNDNQDKDEEKNLEKKMKKASEIAEKYADYDYSDILLYGIIGAAIISVIYKKIKK